MALYLAALLAFSSFWLGEPIRLLKGLLMVSLYAFFDLLWTYLRNRKWYLPLSSVISGLILALIAVPNPNFVLIVYLPLIAVISKQLFHFGWARHIFNPAAFALVFVSFFTPTISWWGVSWGIIPFWIVLISGLVILWRQKRFHVAIPFAITYFALLALLLLISHAPLTPLLGSFREGTTLFFITVMLIEPVTSTFPTRRARIIYGVLTGIFAFLFSYGARFFLVTDPFLYGLLAGNIVSGVLYLSPISKRS
ncbi:MAG: hypothetical protein HY459_01265 [Parcubacteria group bacterium]|nr:hypothetical protein [Parcubacteria group bacterium]